MKKTLWMLLSAAVFPLAAGEITLDGKLDEPEWKQAKKYTGFSRFASDPKGPNVSAQTEFSFVCTKDKVYAGIKCHEPLMEKLRKATPTGIWYTDGVELFFSPAGTGTEFYQFLVTYTNFRFAMYYEESGGIKPDPFAPEWKSAVYSGPDFWSIEIEFPLSAFYMTRQNMWNTKWKINVGRSRYVASERTSYTKSRANFWNIEEWPKIGGFPLRPAADDVFITSAVPDISSFSSGKYRGTMRVLLGVPVAGKYALNGNALDLKAGDSAVNIPVGFGKEGKHDFRLEVKRLSDGKTFSRYYPVYIKYQPVKVKLTAPAYRNNFYPGQDSSRIAGLIEYSGKDPVKLTLDVPGVEKKTVVLDSKRRDFIFDTKTMKTGNGTLRIEAGKYTASIPVRKLAPTGHRMSWIENGNLVVDGKPVASRRLYAKNYMGGEAFTKRYLADDLCETPEVNLGGGLKIDPIRNKQLLGAEFTRDIRPKKAYLDMVDKVIESSRGKDFVYYYISDEPECHGISPIYLQHIYEHIAAKDPYHVVLMASRNCDKFIECADWFETHPYINPQYNDAGERIFGRELQSLEKFITDVLRFRRPDKCIGFLPTCFTYTSRFADYPTFDEYLCHTMIALIFGAKTLWPYAWFDMADRAGLYEGVRYTFTSLKALSPLILNGRRELVRNSRKVCAACWTGADNRLVVIANMTREKQPVKLPGIKGRFKEFRGPRQFDGFDLTLEPLEVVAATVREMDRGLPSLASVRAKVGAAEKARVSTKNLLFNKHLEIECTASSPIWRTRKLFDGVEDNLGWYENWKKDKFFELAFPKFVPKFSKIRLCGRNLDGVTVKIRKRGDWKTLEPAKKNNGPYFVEFDYGQTWSTVKIRFEFPKNKVELYEIALLK
ncbi:MAG: hypothetical protein J5806_03905 [Lentisphaeria bacterium]|nr:hypothetical protein [Lentisphaeria bacterium]